MNTDEIIDVAENIEDSERTAQEILNGFGLEFTPVMRAIRSLCPEGEGRHAAYKGGFLLGLQLGAMRLDPIVPTPEAGDMSTTDGLGA